MPRRVTDPYEVLGLDHDAAEAEIRTAYLRLARKHHPDKNPGDKTSEWIFKEVQKAYETLRDAKDARPATQQTASPPQRDRAEGDQRKRVDRDRQRQEGSERVKREERNRSKQQQSQAESERWERARTTHTRRSRAESTFLHRTMQWGRWTVYFSNAFLWPAAVAGLLEWLPDRIGLLVLGWMTLGAWMLAWDVVFKNWINDWMR